MSRGEVPLEGRAVWTDADFDQLGWHDASVHAVGFEPRDGSPVSDLLLDIDYIVRWLKPVPPEPNYRFLVAPATLVFFEVWGLEGDLEIQTQLPTIDDIRRDDQAWHVKGHDFELRFTAVGGFRQHFRSPGIEAGSTQALSSRSRGGISFERPTAF